MTKAAVAKGNGSMPRDTTTTMLSSSISGTARSDSSLCSLLPADVPLRVPHPIESERLLARLLAEYV